MSNATKNQFYDICASQVANLNDAFIIHICLNPRAWNIMIY